MLECSIRQPHFSFPVEGPSGTSFFTIQHEVLFNRDCRIHIFITNKSWATKDLIAYSNDKDDFGEFYPWIDILSWIMKCSIVVETGLAEGLTHRLSAFTSGTV